MDLQRLAIPSDAHLRLKALASRATDAMPSGYRLSMGGLVGELVVRYGERVVQEVVGEFRGRARGEGRSVLPDAERLRQLREGIVT